MSNENRTWDLPPSGSSPARTVTGTCEMSLTDEEFLNRYPTVRGVAERWVALAREIGVHADR
ncbi:hypothetical protein N4P33_02995 [Streptomyces sp. 15-116A]|uniref:hypothetical protein n=1 Tax=unclassified Streptomyces TaxID=2593676 RepID=UPI0021B2483D|nr:hypothetical protein [Streptomyces sp. 15-116A]MCT7351136.1 hypothetical protein [Streptomyces sp. 15-116A]